MKKDPQALLQQFRRQMSAANDNDAGADGWMTFQIELTRDEERELRQWCADQFSSPYRIAEGGIGFNSLLGDATFRIFYVSFENATDATIYSMRYC